MATITLKNIPAELNGERKICAEENHNLAEAILDQKEFVDLGGSSTPFQIHLLGLRL
jgi:hypothetical protein